MNSAIVDACPYSVTRALESGVGVASTNSPAWNWYLPCNKVNNPLPVESAPECVLTNVPAAIPKFKATLRGALHGVGNA